MNVFDTSAPATTVRLSGEIDIFSSAALRERLLGELRRSSSLLVLDLSRVTFCDTSGLGVLVGIQRRARLMGITLALTGALPYMARLLHTTGLDRRLPTVA